MILSSPSELAGLIDHTLLHPDARVDDISRLCGEALDFKFATVCVNPVYVRQCADHLSNSGIGVCTVVGFPLGAASTAQKVAAVQEGLIDGAVEFDMVMNLGAFKSGDVATAVSDIKAVVAAAESNCVKVIIEACLLNDNEKVSAAKAVVDSGAHFVKTSTGFSTGGATLPDVNLLRKTVGEEFGVKASGGIKEFERAVSFLEAGASRIGASASVAIVTWGHAASEY
ncbi:MAG: deoxyribose-phosphate aldolase [Candidatus Marinimicrobia bacterium]|nr:deoxyribose-phosphate aldolase [Candidatus Neomarinimicrobiota bacterium]|tara:strand:+ start:9232 stop:9912 length:681 start_codon:yes stop_codon:yes gene_type:complete